MNVQEAKNNKPIKCPRCKKVDFEVDVNDPETYTLICKNCSWESRKHPRDAFKLIA